jgi:hypothetical protein
MMTDEELESLRVSWSQACAGSDVGLWWVADDVRQLQPRASEEEVRLETLRALRPLLTAGTLRAVSLLPGGAYHAWEGSVDEQLARIDRAWATAGRPPDIGEVVWFIGVR